jgi:hypothetical protein
VKAVALVVLIAFSASAQTGPFKNSVPTDGISADAPKTDVKYVSDDRPEVLVVGQASLVTKDGEAYLAGSGIYMNEPATIAFAQKLTIMDEENKSLKAQNASLAEEMMGKPDGINLSPVAIGLIGVLSIMAGFFLAKTVAK